jgi:DNA primase
MIPQSFIQDLLARVDIVDVVGSAVPLKRAGANLAACCPFHTEKSPSFTVSPSKQFYHCFGCGAHGTAISFLMEYHGLGFIDALKDLAGQVGMTLPELPRGTPSSEQKDTGPALTEVMARAARFYKDQLKGSDKAVDYLKGRGLTGEIAARFGIGYAPEGWQNLAAVFGDYDSPELQEAGLVIRNEEGRRYDRFRDRIMFPIVNPRGDIIGFGGRVLGVGEPKYLNSPETPIFEKGRELYGLFQARLPIRKHNRVIVVEGYMDVVALAQNGVGNAVATLGTATTPVHVQKLLRQADRITFCFDGDAAGRRAAWRALEVTLQVVADGKQVSFLFLPDREDPDSYVRRAGSDAFEALVDNAEPLSRYLIRELQSRVDMETAEGKAAFLKDADLLVRQIAAPNLAVTMRAAVASAAGMPPPEPAPRSRGFRDDRPAPPSRPRRPASIGLEESVLLAVVGRPDLNPLVLQATALAPATGLWEVIRDISSRIEAGELGTLTASILQHLEDSDRGEVAARVQVWLLELGDDHDFEAELRGVVARLAQLRRRAQWEDIARGVRTVGELSPEARELLPGAGRP